MVLPIRFHIEGVIIIKWLENSLKPYTGLPGSIYVLFFASLVNYLGNFVHPLLTMLLTFKLGLNVGTVGIIVAINSGLSMIGTMIGGKLIDSIGRKKILMIFRTAAGIGYALCAFITEPIAVTTVLILSNFLGGFSEPVYNTIITDLTEGEQRKASFSLSYISINIGFSLGTLLAGFLYENFLMLLFLGDALTTFISVILVLSLVPETKPDKKKLETIKGDSLEVAEDTSLLSALLKRPELLKFSFVMVIYFIVFSQFTFGLSLQIGHSFKDNASLIFGSLITINAVMCSTITVFINSFTKNLKAALSICIGGVLYALGFGMMFFIDAYYMFIISTVIWTCGEIIVTTNTNVYIASHTPITHRGRFNAIFPIIRKIGFSLGPIIAGTYVKYTNIKNLWILIAILSSIGAFMMYRLYSLEIKYSVKIAEEKSA